MVVPKAVIAVAGTGSRFFPVAKTINKCMLPVLDRPVVAYAVADCLAAGVEQIAIVTSPGETGRQVARYFTEDPDLKAYFASRGWQDKYETIANLHTAAEFTSIEQPRDDRYGTALPALPALLATDFVGTDDFFLLASDEVGRCAAGARGDGGAVHRRDPVPMPSFLRNDSIPNVTASVRQRDRRASAHRDVSP